MYGGTISGNTSTTNGGGVYMSAWNSTLDSTFTMSGGTVSGNTATEGRGGGVYLDTGNSTFTMSGGTISDNTAPSSNGAYLNAATDTFNMTGGYLDGIVKRLYSEATVSIAGGYLSSSTLSDVSRFIAGGYTAVDISKSNLGDAGYIEGFPYAVYVEGDTSKYAIEDVNVTYGTPYALNVTNPDNIPYSVSYQSLPTTATVRQLCNATFAEYLNLATRTYYSARNVYFDVTIAKKPLEIDVGVGYTVDENGNIDGAKVNSLSYTGAINGDEVTVSADTPVLVKDEEENVVGVNVSFTLGGADSGNYSAETKYIAISKDLSSNVAGLEKELAEAQANLAGEIAHLEELIKTESDPSEILAQIAAVEEAYKAADALADGQIADLKSDLTALEKAYQEADETADGQITDLKSDLTALEKAYQEADETADGQIADLKSDLGALSAVVWVLFAVIAVLLIGGAAGFVLFLRKKRGGNTPNGDGPFGTAQ